MDNLVDTIIGALASRAVWAILILLATFFGVGIYHKDRRKFSGRWRMKIQWTPEHAVKLFGMQVAEPHSVGYISISYGLGPKHNQYWGLAYFELFAGTKRYAHLCVELEAMHVEHKCFSRSFPFVGKTELKELSLRALIREATEKSEKFNYGPWALYSMKFGTTSARGLSGEMILVEAGETVGTVTAWRTG